MCGARNVIFYVTTSFPNSFYFVQKLRKKGLPCKAYHAGLKDGERSSVQEDFMDGKISVIVATVSFGMGVDKASVRGVVHWCAPQNVAAYYQVHFCGCSLQFGFKICCAYFYL